MIALLDNGQDLDKCAAEIGCEVGQLLTPLTNYRLRDPARPWAIDNGAFARLELSAFEALLKRHEHHRDRCLFVTVPDIVGSARRTLELFQFWKPRLAGWKLALACQDGQEHLPIPWDEIDAVFIGGTTTFKDREHAAHIVQAAKAMGKWVHVGRVNHGVRFEHFLAARRGQHRWHRDRALQPHAGGHRQPPPATGTGPDMRVTHELTFSRQCPVNDALDHYELCVETTRTVKVEDILAAIEALPEKAFQEDITVALAAKLGCCVTTVGYHSGVKTTCTA